MQRERMLPCLGCGEPLIVSRISKRIIHARCINECFNLQFNWYNENAYQPNANYINRKMGEQFGSKCVGQKNIASQCIDCLVGIEIAIGIEKHKRQVVAERWIATACYSDRLAERRVQRLYDRSNPDKKWTKNRTFYSDITLQQWKNITADCIIETVNGGLDEGQTAKEYRSKLSKCSVCGTRSWHPLKLKQKGICIRCDAIISENKEHSENKVRKEYGDEFVGLFAPVERQKSELLREIQLTESIINENNDRRAKRAQRASHSVA